MDLSEEIKNTRKEDLEIQNKTFENEELENIDAKELEFSKCKFNNFIRHTCSMKHLFMIYLDKRMQAYTYACMISALLFS